MRQRAKSGNWLTSMHHPTHVLYQPSLTCSCVLMVFGQRKHVARRHSLYKLGARPQWMSACQQTSKLCPPSPNTRSSVTDTEHGHSVELRFSAKNESRLWTAAGLSQTVCCHAWLQVSTTSLCLLQIHRYRSTGVYHRTTAGSGLW